MILPPFGKTIASPNDMPVALIPTIQYAVGGSHSRSSDNIQGPATSVSRLTSRATCVVVSADVGRRLLERSMACSAVKSGLKSGCGTYVLLGGAPEVGLGVGVGVDVDIGADVGIGVDNDLDTGVGTEGVLESCPAIANPAANAKNRLSKKNSDVRVCVTKASSIV